MSRQQPVPVRIVTAADRLGRSIGVTLGRLVIHSTLAVSLGTLVAILWWSVAPAAIPDSFPAGNPLAAELGYTAAEFALAFGLLLGITTILYYARLAVAWT